MAERNFYEILKVNRNATFEEIERAYEYLKSHYKSVLTFEHNKADDKKWKRVKAAYKVLSNKDKRAQYDRTLPKQIIQEEIPRKSEPKTYYEILGVNRNATLEEIEAAYKNQLSFLKIFLDIFNDKKAAEEFLKEINAAYEVLKDEDKRAEYDETLPEQKLDPKDCYAILDVSETATIDEIKTAYKKLAKKYSSDDKASKEKLREINAAHVVILRYRDSAEYDQLERGSRQLAPINYYAILDLGYGATDADIKRAYKRLAKKYHPDFNLNDKFSEKKMMEINAAYEVLSDKYKRAKYNRTLPGQELTPEDCYAILGVSETATFYEIKRAYKKLAKKWHPDLNRDNLKFAEEKMAELNMAYEFLMDKAKRADEENFPTPPPKPKPKPKHTPEDVDAILDQFKDFFQFLKQL